MPLNLDAAGLLTTPPAPTIIHNALGTGPAIVYQIVAVNAAGQDSIASPAAITAAINASPPNNTLTWPTQPGAYFWRVIKNGCELAAFRAGMMNAAGLVTYTDSGGALGRHYTYATANPPLVTIAEQAEQPKPGEYWSKQIYFKGEQPPVPLQCPYCSGVALPLSMKHPDDYVCLSCQRLFQEKEEGKD